jgi:hypothetical protein
MPFVSPSLTVWVGIPALSLLVAGLLIAGFGHAADGGRRRAVMVRAAAGIGAYFVVSALLAASGLLAFAGKGPPPMLAMMAMLSVTTVLVALGPLGGRIAESLPLWALVGLQAFRLPLEVVLWRAAEDGTMPVQMSFEGRNFDIVTGATALVLAIVLYRKQISEAWVLSWNVLGMALLFNIVGVAIASLPWVHAFGPDNVNEWVLHFPFVWLPAVLVQTALFGHLIVFRRLRAGARHRAVLPAQSAAHGR